MDMPTWYAALIKPEWAPATEVFGIAWGIIYPMMVLSFGYIFIQAFRGKLPKSVAVPFAVNLFFNLLFPYIQFTLRSSTGALLCIVVVLASLIWAMRAAYPHARWVTWFQIPYMAWGTFATALQTFIWWWN